MKNILPNELIRPALANTGNADEKMLVTLFVADAATDDGTLRSTGAALLLLLLLLLELQLTNCECDLE